MESLRETLSQSDLSIQCASKGKSEYTKTRFTCLLPKNRAATMSLCMLSAFTGFMDALGHWSNAKHQKLLIIDLGRKSCHVVLCSVYAGSLIKNMSGVIKIKKTRCIKYNKKLKHPIGYAARYTRCTPRCY